MRIDQVLKPWGASGDDRTSGAQSMRVYMRGVDVVLWVVKAWQVRSLA
jgi:hypothetical protein